MGGLGKPNRGRGHGETFFPDSGSDRDSDKTFQISRNLGHEHIEFFCLLDSQPWTTLFEVPARHAGYPGIHKRLQILTLIYL